jgi:hypothetical protein
MMVGKVQQLDNQLTKSIDQPFSAEVMAQVGDLPKP